MSDQENAIQDDDDFDAERNIDERLKFRDYADYRSAYCDAPDLLNQAEWIALKHPFGVLPPAPDYLWYAYKYYARSCQYYNSPPLSESQWNTRHEEYLATLSVEERNRQMAYIAYLLDIEVSQ